MKWLFISQGEFVIKPKQDSESNRISNELVFSVTPDERITYVSPAFSQLLGVAPAELLQHNLYNFLPETVILQARTIFTQMLEKPQRMVLELASNGETGIVRWRKWTSIPILNENGSLAKILVSGEDITAQKRMETAHEVLAQFSLALNQAVDLQNLYSAVLTAATEISSHSMAAFLLLDDDKQVQVVRTVGEPGKTLVNEFKKFFQTAVEQSHCSHSLLWEAQELDPGGASLKEGIKSIKILTLNQGSRILGAIGLASNTDEMIPVELIPFLENMALQAAGVINCFVERSTMQQRMDNLLSVFETITEMLFLISVDGIVLQTNRAVTRILGFSQQDFIGKPLYSFQPEHARGEFSKILARIHDLREGSFRIPFLTADGKQLHVEMDLSYGLWERQEVLIAVCRDVTYRVEIEQSEREQRVLASALADVGTILNSSLNLDEVLDRILDNVDKVVPNVITNIMTVEGDQARVIRARGYEAVGTEDLLRARVFQIKKIKNLYKMAYTLQPALTEDTTQDPNWMTIPESIWVRSFVGAPITFQGKLFGFINCDSDQPGFYNRNHAHKLKLFADQAGVAMANATMYTKARQQARQLEMINDLTRIVLSSGDASQTVTELMHRLLELFGAENVYLTRYDEETGTVFGSANTTPYSSSYSSQFSVGDEATLTRFCLEKGKAVYIPDLQQSELISERFHWLYSEKSLLALPMISEGKKIGAIILGFKSFHVNTEEENTIGEQAAAQIASVLSKIYTLEQERNQSEQLAHTNSLIAVLSKVGVTVNSSSGKGGVIESLVAELEKLGIHSVLSLTDAQSDRQVIRYISRRDVVVPALERLLGRELPEFVIPVDEFMLPHESANGNRTYFIEDPSLIVSSVLPDELAPFKKRINGILSIEPESRGVLVPLILAGRVIGHLILWGKEIKQIDQQAAAIFADQIAAAIDNANLLEKVRLLAVTDEMTGIYNRRGLNECGEHEIEIARRLDYPLTVIMFDIDHFKLVNDQFGHVIGDQVLCQIADRCKKKIREMDIFGRYGGEEFVVMLIETGTEVALTVAERIRKIVSDSRFQTDAGDVAITISLGVAEMEPEDETFEALIIKADRALYQAKQRGRNQVALWQKPKGDENGFH